MLFEKKDSLEEIFKAITHELHRGALDKKHPFRFVVLATHSQSFPDTRYVVLRSVSKTLEMSVFSDFRTEKVKSIVANPNVSLLFYHPQKRVQLRVSAKAFIHQQNEIANREWTKIQGEAQKAYNSSLPPGEMIEDLNRAYSWNEDLTDPSNFAVIKVIPEKIDVLQLSGMEHIRASFKRKETIWKGSWLVP